MTQQPATTRRTAQRVAALITGALLALTFSVIGAAPASANIDSVSDTTPADGDNIDVQFTVPNNTSINRATLAVCAKTDPGKRCNNDTGTFIDLTPVSANSTYTWSIDVFDDFTAYNFQQGTEPDPNDNVSCLSTGSETTDEQCTVSVSYYQVTFFPTFSITFVQDDGVDLDFS